MRRKIYDQMKEWKTNDKGTSALMIDGARRVGKSFITEEFARNEYKSYILIDFANLPSDVEYIFEHDKTDLDLFYNKLSVFYRKKLYRRESVIIFDEVQLYPKARQLIKYLVQDGRYDFIETGSLISIRKNIEKIVIPSEEENINLFPMDFEEFLWALGDETTIPYIRECYLYKRPVGQTIHRKIMNDFRQYMLVGGMPQAVKEFCSSKDFYRVDRIKRRILSLYREDVTKFARGYEEKVLSVFDEIPSALAKKEKKYKLAAIEKGARFDNYQDSFLWLSEAMIINNCFNATDPNIGLSMSLDHTTRKCYMSDTGLLVTHSFWNQKYTENELYRAVLLDRVHINEGMLMENIVSQELRSKGYQLYFYSRSDTNKRENNIEIDFLIRQKNKITPIEVKSGNYRTHSSLDKFRNRFSQNLGQSFILYTKDIMEKDGILHLPLYMSAFL